MTINSEIRNVFVDVENIKTAQKERAIDKSGGKDSSMTHFILITKADISCPLFHKKYINFYNGSAPCSCKKVLISSIDFV